MRKQNIVTVVTVAGVIASGFSLPVKAQQPGANMLEEVVVTARRREEFLQDVPISMTIFSQDEIDNRNILSAADLSVYTPSMSTNTRFGTDFATFSIRGFSQELRTTASVGVYFAEVVAPRGANTSTSGDGAGPGDLFDLENVQVLKGAQGTLFGRNTTGGAVLFTPRRPQDEFGGYLEASIGNYDMTRLQGVLNLPVHDRVKLRLGLDYNKRDGYMNNLSPIGPRDFADVDYLAGRASLVIDITDSLENYTIFKTVSSENNGTPGQTFACNSAPEGLGVFYSAPCNAMLASNPKSTDYYNIFSTIPEPINELDQWQLINTTTWEISDSFMIKNILSYGELETQNRTETFGTNLQFPIPAFDGIIPGVPAGGLGTQEILFAQTGASPDYLTTDQNSFVAELQLQGDLMDDRLTWQAGLYYEKSEPDELAGSRSPNYLSCLPETLYGDPSGFMCNDLLALFLPFPEWGVINQQPYGITYENQAAYAQTTFAITDYLSVTGGLRYTVDKTDGRIESTFYRFPSNPITGGYFPVSFTQFNVLETDTKSEEPTWLLGVDYTPAEDILLYAKYTRGYRQGGLNIAAPEGLQTYGPETVDTYEIGAKTTFAGALPGQFNIAAFYNDFKDQAIQVGVLPPGAPGSTVISNIGKSTIWGVEIDGAVQLFDGFLLSASYAYLNTEVVSFVDPSTDPRFDDFRAIGGVVSNANAVEGDPLPFAPENSLTLTADYRLPLDASLGEAHAIVSYIYTDEMQTTSPSFSPFGVLDEYDLLNMNFNWNGLLGSPLDASVFVTNALDEEYTTFVSGNWNSIGFETRYVGQPRMYGMRLRYNF